MPACTSCGETLPAYFAVLHPAPTICTLCRALRPYQPGGTHYAPHLALAQRKVLAQQARPVASASPDIDALETRIVAWAVAHNNRWPNFREFGAKNGLPPLSAIVRRWGGLVLMRQALHARYPALQGRRVLAWTPESVYQAVAAWIDCHPGTIPMTCDFQQDDETLPLSSVMYRLFRGLKQFYRVFENGQYAARFEAIVATQRRIASDKGRLVQSAQGTARHAEHKSPRP